MNKQLLFNGKKTNTFNQTLKLIKEETIEKWGEVGFLEGLEGQAKDTMAQLYENQYNFLSETTTTQSTGSFEAVAFPLIRRTFTKLLANDIVSVQALNMPIGKIFSFVPKISERESDGSHTTLGGYADCFASGCPLTQFQCKNLYDLYYNDGLFDYSKGKITINTNTSLSPVVLSGCVNGEDNFITASSFDLDKDGSVRRVVVELTDIDNNPCAYSILSKTVNGVTRKSNSTGSTVDSEAFTSSLKIVTNTPILDPSGNVIYAAGEEVRFRFYTQKYGKQLVQYPNPACDSQGRLYLEVMLEMPYVGTAPGTYDGFIGADTTVTLDLTASYATYSDLEGESEIGEVTFEMSEMTIEVTERKLRINWTPEFATDISAFHNIDAEAELTAILSEQIANEIDREILRDLRKEAAWQTSFDYYGWKNSSNVSTIYTQKEWNQELISKINQVSAQIHKSTLRGGANFIVVSSEISAMLENMEYFHVTNASAEQNQYNMGIEKVGNLGGRYTVYRDPFAKAEDLLIGHKGTSILDSGYVYAPYVPVQLTPTIMRFDNFTNVKGVWTRYAKKMVNNRYYGKVTVFNVPKFDTKELR